MIYFVKGDKKDTHISSSIRNFFFLQSCIIYVENSILPSQWVLTSISGNKGYTVKKGLRFSRPPPGCHLPNSPWPGIIELFPARESLVSDIPALDRKTANLFCSVWGWNVYWKEALRYFSETAGGFFLRLCERNFKTSPFLRVYTYTYKKENKIFLVYCIRKFRGFGCKVMYD